MNFQPVLRIVLIVNAAGCLAASIVLFALPFAIPAMIGIVIPPGQYMVPRLLGAAELAIGTVCLMTARRPSGDGYRLCVALLLVFHLGSIAAGAAELIEHFNIVVALNIAVRAVITALLVVLAIPLTRSRAASAALRHSKPEHSEP